MEHVSVAHDSKAGPELLYHYTDAVGLHGIVSSGEVWATDALYLNDATEFVYIFNLLEEELIAFERTEPRPPEDALAVSELIRATATTQLSLMRDDVPCFVACFCEEKDLLSQWRAYSQGVGGFSLGFRRSVVESSTAGSNFGAFRFEPVLYDAMVQRQSLQQGVLRAVEQYRDEIASGVVDDRLRVWQALVGGYFGTVGFNALLNKSPGFSEEREWRIIVRVHRSAVRDASLPRFRPSPRLGLVPYVPLNFLGDQLSRMPIAEIVIGPTPHPELVERSVRLLLAAQGYEEGEVEVTHSVIPLRA